MNDNQRPIPSSNGGVNMDMYQPDSSQTGQVQGLNQVNNNQAPAPVDSMMNQENTPTPISNMNVDGAYNKMNVAPEYVNDAQVKANVEATKKNTVPVTNELKTVIVIAIILLIFIIVMPFLFDIISNIKYR